MSEVPMSRRLGSLAFALALLWASPGAADPVDAPESAPVEPEIRSLDAASPLPDGFLPGSSYGWRSSPRTGRRTFHAGLDFLAPRGTEVRAAMGGVVERVTRDNRGRTRFGGYGRAVVLRHPQVGVWTFYAHLDSVAVRAGQTLEAGEVLGTVGNTTNHRYRGMATHLHFEVRRVGRGGRSPFPGPYRRYNLDPRAWLRSIGVDYGEERDESALLFVRAPRG